MILSTAFVQIISIFWVSTSKNKNFKTASKRRQICKELREKNWIFKIKFLRALTGRFLQRSNATTKQFYQDDYILNSWIDEMGWKNKTISRNWRKNLGKIKNNDQNLKRFHHFFFNEIFSISDKPSPCTELWILSGVG